MKISELLTDFLEYLEIEPHDLFPRTQIKFDTEFNLALHNLIADYSAQEKGRGECQTMTWYTL